jgi:NhaP-type Na+/H+ or K+/H+ antiporter
VGGLVFGNTLRAPSMFIREFMEGEGQLLTLVTFLVFGAVLAPIGLEHANWKTVTLALLFLTVVRMVPIWLSLAGLKLSNYEKLFLSWFGPRGLASILFALLVLEDFAVPGAEELTACVVLTVLLSIVLHGLTATPLSNRFKKLG